MVRLPVFYPDLCKKTSKESHRRLDAVARRRYISSWESKQTRELRPLNSKPFLVTLDVEN